MKPYDRSKTEYGIRIKRIIEEERKDNNKAITLSAIQKKYQSIYSCRISLATISRILRNHLSLHFRRITIKNPKLNQKWYQFMHFLFLKAIMKGIQDGLDIIYLDETGCYLENKNFYDWVGKDNSIIKGADKNLKEKINIIMAMGLKEVLHYKLISSSVNSENFGNFVDELANKLSDEQKKKALFVLDNASYHKTKEIIKKFNQYKFKVITNIPYKSEFNGIEFFFACFKNEYYKFIFENREEQKQKIKEIIESENIKKNIPSFYLQAYENYKKCEEEILVKLNIEELSKNIKIKKDSK